MSNPNRHPLQRKHDFIRIFNSSDEVTMDEPSDSRTHELERTPYTDYKDI